MKIYECQIFKCQEQIKTKLATENVVTHDLCHGNWPWGWLL